MPPFLARSSSVDDVEGAADLDECERSRRALLENARAIRSNRSEMQSPIPVASSASRSHVAIRRRSRSGRLGTGMADFLQQTFDGVEAADEAGIIKLADHRLEDADPEELDRRQQYTGRRHLPPPYPGNRRQRRSQQTRGLFRRHPVDLAGQRLRYRPNKGVAG